MPAWCGTQWNSNRFPAANRNGGHFDESLMEHVAQAISDEARAKYNQYKTFGETGIYQGLTFWSPNINLDSATLVGDADMKPMGKTPC